MGERKSLSKRTRFEIFKRDGFRCHYCGATPVQKVLRVDHVVPVAEGGEDDPANLITACFDCNAGKAAVPLDKQKFKTEFATEAHREHAEQIREWLAIQRDVHAAKEEALDQVVAEWERRVGSAPRSLRSRLWKMLEEFGLPRLVEAFEIVASKDIRRDDDQIKYLHGILRQWRAGEKGTAQASPPELKPQPNSLPLARIAMAACNKAVAETGAEPSKFPTLGDKWAHVVDAFLVATAAGPEARESSVRQARRSATESPDPVAADGWRRPWPPSFESWGVTLELRPDGGGVVRLDSEFDRYKHAYWELASAVDGLSHDIAHAAFKGDAIDLGVLLEDLFRVRSEIGAAIDHLESLDPPETE